MVVSLFRPSLLRQAGYKLSKWGKNLSFQVSRWNVWRTRSTRAEILTPALILRKLSLRMLVERIMLIREKLKEKLRILGTPGSWEHLTAQSGMCSFIGLHRRYPKKGHSVAKAASGQCPSQVLSPKPASHDSPSALSLPQCAVPWS